MEIAESGKLMLVEHFEEHRCIGANRLFSNENESNVIGRTLAPLKVVIVHKDAMLDLLSNNKLFLKEFLVLVSNRSTMLSEKINSLSFRSLEEKIIGFLYERHMNQKTTKVKLYLSKKRLAELFGVARTSLSRRLTDMEKRGLLEVKGTHIQLKNPFFDAYKKAFVIR
ncbi:MAG: Crp/Fnr family transcriptional regulator [Bacillota bacterium]